MIAAASVAGSPSTSVTWEVNGVVGGNTAIGPISVAGLYSAPRVAGTAVVSAVSDATPSNAGQAQIVVVPRHRVAVRTGTDGLAELYDRFTGSTFIARGNNFIRLATQTDYNSGAPFYHSTFNVGLYDAVGADTALAVMQARGFNTVRVFWDPCPAIHFQARVSIATRAAYSPNRPVSPQLKSSLGRH